MRMRSLRHVCRKLSAIEIDFYRRPGFGHLNTTIMFLTPICFFPLSDSQSIYIQENHFKLWTPLRWSVSIECSTVCVLILGDCRCPVSLHGKRVEVLWFKNNLTLLRWPHNLKGEYCYNILLAIQLSAQEPGVSIKIAELLGTSNIGHQLTDYKKYIIVFGHAHDLLR